MQNPSPATAKLITYYAANGKRGSIKVWQPDPNKQEWVWVAMGNSDKAGSLPEALWAAKRWIRDGGV